MMERMFVQQKLKEFQIQEYVDKKMSRVGHSHTQVKKTPLGDKVLIYAARPGLVVGRKGANISELTRELKKNFGLESPQIELSEVQDLMLNPAIVAERIVTSLERFGPNRFKGIGHKMLDNVMRAGARGVEILISGKIPGSRAKSWRFYQGYLKKCGDFAISGVRMHYRPALLKSGIVGIKVSIMPPDLKLPDELSVRLEAEEVKKPELLKKSVKKKRKSVKKKRKVKKKEVSNEEKGTA